MPKYTANAVVCGGKFIGEYEADTPELALEMANSEAHVSLCWQCSSECDDAQILYVEISDVNGNRVATSEDTRQDEIRRLKARCEALEADNRRLNDIIRTPTWVSVADLSARCEALEQWQREACVALREHAERGLTLEQVVALVLRDDPANCDGDRTPPGAFEEAYCLAAAGGQQEVGT